MTFGGGGSDFVVVVCDELEELELSEEVAELAGPEPARAAAAARR